MFTSSNVVLFMLCGYFVLTLLWRKQQLCFHFLWFHYAVNINTLCWGNTKMWSIGVWFCLFVFLFLLHINRVSITPICSHVFMLVCHISLFKVFFVLKRFLFWSVFNWFYYMFWLVSNNNCMNFIRFCGCESLCVAPRMMVLHLAACCFKAVKLCGAAWERAEVKQKLKRHYSRNIFPGHTILQHAHSDTFSK